MWPLPVEEAGRGRKISTYGRATVGDIAGEEGGGEFIHEGLVKSINKITCHTKYINWIIIWGGRGACGSPCQAQSFVYQLGHLSQIQNKKKTLICCSSGLLCFHVVIF